MKKIIISILTIVFVIATFCMTYNPVYANNNVQTAEMITLNTTKYHTFDDWEYEYYYKFVPNESGYYEVVVNNFEEDETGIVITDSTGEVLDYGDWNQYYNDVIGVAELKANKTYYIEVYMFLYSNSKTASIKIQKHEHTMKEDYLYPAEIYEYSDGSWTGWGGRIYKKCSRCDFNKDEEIYKIKSLSLTKQSYTYNGKEQKPSVTVKDTKGSIISSTNYSVTYANGRKKVGKYKVTVKFKGNYYTGTKTLYYTIKPKETSLSSVKATSKGFTAKWKKQSTETTGYQVQYSTSSKFKSAKTVTIGKNKTLSTKVKKLKGKKKYYVRVRTYKTVGKTKYYSSWSKAKSVTTKK